MHSKGRQIALNMTSQIVAFICTLLINFFLVPVVVGKIGKEIYGLYTLANNFLEYAGVITIVINGMANRYITIHYVRGETEQANRYFTTVTFMNILLTVALSVPALLIVVFLEQLMRVPAVYVSDVQVLWLFTFLMFFVNLVFSRYEVAAFAKNRLEVTALVNLASILLKALLLLLAFGLLQPNIGNIGIIVFICALFSAVAKVAAKRRLAPDIKYDRTLFSIRIVKTLARDGLWNAISQLSQLLFTGFDLLIANFMIGAGAMSLLSIAKTLPIMMIGFIGVIAGAFYPIMTISYSTRSKQDFVREVGFAAKLCGYICSVPIIGVLAYGKAFFSLWLPSLSEAENNTVQILSVLTILPQLVSIYVFPLHQINTITCKVRIPALLDCLIGVCNIGLVYILLKTTNLGIYAVAGVSSFLLFLKILTFVPLYASSNIDVSKKVFYPYLLKGLLLNVVIYVTFYVFNSIYAVHSWSALFLLAGISAGIGYAMGFFIIFSKEERTRAIGLVVKKIRRD